MLWAIMRLWLSTSTVCAKKLKRIRQARAISRLYGALEQGESLTTMYMRINNACFDADAERDLLDVDVVDDPLIRCLFSDTFGAYQAAQLRRLLAR